MWFVNQFPSFLLWFNKLFLILDISLLFFLLDLILSSQIILSLLFLVLNQDKFHCSNSCQHLTVLKVTILTCTSQFDLFFFFFFVPNVLKCALSPTCRNHLFLLNLLQFSQFLLRSVSCFSQNRFGETSCADWWKQTLRQISVLRAQRLGGMWTGICTWKQKKKNVPVFQNFSFFCTFLLKPRIVFLFEV